MKRTRIHLLFAATLVGLGACADHVIVLSPSRCAEPGRLVPTGEVPTPEDLATDAYCARLVRERSAPNGFVTIFGSARAREGMQSYDQTREFARAWTEEHGDRFPILTGGGPGIMDAGNRGAHEAGGVSLGYSTYFGSGNEPLNEYTTDGYVFASFSQREADMVDGAAAIVIAPGGVGTEWEIYETIAKIQTGKKDRVPVILLGPQTVWASLFTRMNQMVRMGTISPEDPELLQVAPTPAEAIRLIEEAIIDSGVPAVDQAA